MEDNSLICYGISIHNLQPLKAKEQVLRLVLKQGTIRFVWPELLKDGWQFNG